MVPQRVQGKHFGEKGLAFLREESMFWRRKFEVIKGTEQAPGESAVTDE